MPFPRKLLNDGEELILDLRPHWWQLSGPASALMVMIVAAAAIPAQVHGTLHQPVLIVLLALLVATLLWFGFRFARWNATNFVITTERLIFRSGVLAKQGHEIPIDRLTDIGFHQTLFERILGAGDLLLESAGARGQETYTDVPHPARVQSVIYRQVEAARTRDQDRAAGRRELSLPEQIEKLDELRQRGVITQAEFDAKKAQLLERM